MMKKNVRKRRKLFFFWNQKKKDTRMEKRFINNERETCYKNDSCISTVVYEKNKNSLTAVALHEGGESRKKGLFTSSEKKKKEKKKKIFFSFS